MSMNRFKGKEKTKNYKNISPEEQKKLSKENISDENDEKEINTKIAQTEKEKFDKDQARNIQ